MGDEQTSSPRNAVFTTALWDGGFCLADWNLHLERLRAHAKLLRIEVPDDFSLRIATFFQKVAQEGLYQHSRKPTFLLRVECSNLGELSFDIRKLELRNEEIDAITRPAPRWSMKINGTKHGDWQPYLDAHAVAKKQGADLAFHVHDFAIVDADRAAPIVLDEDGVAWVAAPSEGGVTSITLQTLLSGIESAGIPVQFGRLNERLVARAAEVVAIGSGIGACRILSLDGEALGEGEALTMLCQSLLELHYRDQTTWIDVRMIQ